MCECGFVTIVVFYSKCERFESVTTTCESQWYYNNLVYNNSITTHACSAINSRV